ncbi:MAG TPA: hypothetical protein VNZ05_06320 [Solirubrobacteraceae bacterium]|jgi:hypothetical protein|nr:hypothetical protein [Solirubrobacteraceae bacterium]
MQDPRDTQDTPEQAGRDGRTADVASESERCGPVTVERQRKDDGRALILYSHGDGDAP